MDTSVLVVNCGSSSIKYALVPHDSSHSRLAGLVERLGSSEVGLSGTERHGKRFVQALGDAHHTGARTAILERLGGRLRMEVGRRIVSGGEHFTGATLIFNSVVVSLELTAALAA